jgi:hypothetical protein
MKSEQSCNGIPRAIRKVLTAGVATMVAGAMALAPAAAARTYEANLISNERTINRATVENLQRWVSAGHADWCKDARQVAAEELWRLAPDYSGDGLELNELNADANSNGTNRMTFEWAPLDGRARYRVTVERFDWLLAIAKSTESIVWVPTNSEIRTHQ